MSEIITKALAEHADAIKAFREEVSHDTGELRGRLTNLEQHVVNNDGRHYDDTPHGLDVKSLIENPAFDDIRRGIKGSARQFEMGEMSLKALINLDTSNPVSGSTPYPSHADILPGRLGAPLKPLRLINVLPSRPVRGNRVEYIRLTHTGDAAVQAGEGAEKAEMDFEGELIHSNIATIAVHTTASAQVLDDSDALQAAIQSVMTNKVLTAVETQLITGSGTGDNIEGLYTAATLITPYENTTAERIGSAIATMETDGYQPDIILMNPADWFALSIEKEGDPGAFGPTGAYRYGNPANPARPSLWNRPVITSPKIPGGRVLVGDTSQVTVLDRMAPTVFLSRDHKDYRTRNLVLILVEARVGLELYDALGFRKIDLTDMSA